MVSVFRVRYVLSLPVVAASVLVAAVCFVVRCVSIAIEFIHEQSRQYVWFPTVMVARWVAGVPTWTPDDLIDLNVQPYTKAHIKLAEASDRVFTCLCDKPTCRARGKWIELPEGSVKMTKDQYKAAQEELRRYDRDMNQRTNELRQRLREHASDESKEG